MIQLTRASEYALRGIQYLASQPAGSVCMLSEISEAQEVPISFLGKIFQALSKAKILTSHRGAGGGFSLAHPPAEITLLSVIEAVEGPIFLYECIADEALCPDYRRNGCTIRPVLYEAIAALQDVFGRYTAADLICKPCTSPAFHIGPVAN